MRRIALVLALAFVLVGCWSSDGATAPPYSGELYDDCRELLGNLETAEQRKLLERSGADEGLALLSDYEVRYRIAVMCLLTAAGRHDLLDALIR